MTKIKKIKLFIYSRILGLIFLSISVFTSISLITRSKSDPYFGHFNSLNNIENFFGLFGSYFAGTSFVFYNDISFLVPLFFLTNGYKKIIGAKTNYLVFHFLSFIIGISAISFLFKAFSLESGLIGVLIFEILENNFYYIFNSIFLKNLLFFSFFTISFLTLVYGLSIRLKLLIRFFYFILECIFNIFKFLKISYLVLSLKNFFISSFKKRTLQTKQSQQNRNKKEPIFDNSFKEKDRLFDDNKYSQKTNSHEYRLPPLSLLNLTEGKKLNLKDIEKSNEASAIKLEEILKEYGVIGKIKNYRTGPVITLFEFLPAPGIKTSKVVGLAEDIARSMSSVSARISSQPGKSAIGIEIPNAERSNVFLGDLLTDELFKKTKNGLILALGKSISGEKKYTDLEQMPHLLIAGTTGSGKSVGINSMILSLLFRFKPSECKLILIDPKMLELSIYEDIPHLLTPVVTDPKKAVFALKWVVREMENRYRLMNSAGVKNIKSFNDKIADLLLSGKKLFREVQTGIDKETRIPIIEKQEIPLDRMPLIVVVIDEMADLMMVAGKEVEHLVQRLAQMARASGIHLIAATQRPSVDVITGTIKANFPSRISFRVASRFDSRTILNEMGAEHLLGSGDMLFLESGANLVRLHGGFVSEKEIEDIVKFINSQATSELQMDITNNEIQQNDAELDFNSQSSNVDELYQKAVSIVLHHQKASTSFIQRYLQIGYNRAARIIEKMEEDGIVTEANHVGKRSVLKKNN